MLPTRRTVCASLLAIACLHAASYRSVAIQTGARASHVEQNVAALLAERMREASAVPVVVEREPGGKRASGQLQILIGIPDHHDGIAWQLNAGRIPKLTWLEPGAEGFLLKTVPGTGGATLIAAGIDDRGVLYCAGEILRHMDSQRDQSFEFPDNIHVRTAPAFEVRGTQFNQSAVALKLAKVRLWTERDREHAILDLALAGLNTIQLNGPDDTVGFAVTKKYGLKTLLHYEANRLEGPKEWQAVESIGRPGYVCPSIAPARAALLKHIDEMFSKMPRPDYVRIAGGDGGGCECDMCKPYGGTFIRLCEEMAAIAHKYHPKTEVFVTNQKFNNADDEAIYQYLQEKPRPWLRAFCYGPGSDAMSWQPGARQTHRMDLFRYPGFGPPDRYLREILHQLPPQQDIVFFNELTHWRYSQNGFAQQYPRADRNGDLPPHWNNFIYARRPDKALTMVYDRLSFFAWPRFYHWVFDESMRYGIGDVTHSSGTQDHFNQWMWQRLMWAPQTKLEDVVDEYARTWFGPKAAPLMAQAVFQLEENTQDQHGILIPQKTGIQRYYQLVRDAGPAMSANRMAKSWLWREYMEKAALDRYIQLSVGQQVDLESRVEKAIAQSGSNETIEQALSWFGPQPETAEMAQLRTEAGLLGEQSNALFGVASEGYYNLKHDFIGLGWLKRQLERARAATGPQRAELLGMITHYEDPGPGGFYDRGGTLGSSKDIVNGYPYDFGQPLVQGMLSEGNRHSQVTMHYTQDEDQGVTFQYRNLDPNASYRIRFTLVRPHYQDRYRGRMNQHTETIYAGDAVLARAVEVPEAMSDFFTYDIPRSAIHNGELTVRFERAPDVAHGSRIERDQWRNSGGWGTIVSEAWLMKK